MTAELPRLRPLAEIVRECFADQAEPDALRRRLKSAGVPMLKVGRDWFVDAEEFAGWWERHVRRVTRAAAALSSSVRPRGAFRRQERA